MATVRLISRRYVGGGASYMYKFHATYHWGLATSGGVIEVGPWSNDNEAREEAQAIADEYELNNDPRPLPPRRRGSESIIRKRLTAPPTTSPRPKLARKKAGKSKRKIKGR